MNKKRKTQMEELKMLGILKIKFHLQSFVKIQYMNSQPTFWFQTSLKLMFEDIKPYLPFNRNL
jgi:hypothetical protein